MTREQMKAKAMRLHGEGLSDREIGERFGVKAPAVWKWRHPERTREFHRAYEARPERKAAKRAWERDPANRGDCEKCGGKMGVGHAYDGICASCRSGSWRALLDRLVALRCEGLPNRVIAEQEGIDSGYVGRLLYLARTQHGAEFPACKRGRPPAKAA